MLSTRQPGDTCRPAKRAPSHYRQQQAFTFGAVAAAGTALRRLTHHAVVARDAVGGEVVRPSNGRAAELGTAFWAALCDDLDSPRALSIASTVTSDPELPAGERWTRSKDNGDL
jgi:cysteinyl-tRNA synthetase